jgi:hypothetical protein
MLYSHSMLKKAFFILVYIFAVIGFVLTAGYFAVKFHLTNSGGIVDLQNEFFRNGSARPTIDTEWTKTTEWQTLKVAASKDEVLVAKISAQTGVNGRLIIAQLVSEQMRLYTSEREVFEQIFAPLKILGSQSQFSWGIMGIKQDTAIAIEQHLKDPASPYYLGKEYEHMLDFKTDNPDEERFNRITDEHDHTYAYLYTALYLKQIMTQWKKAGFDISGRPEILSTLYNIGFAHSEPKSDPGVGGAEIDINGRIYSFGSLAYYFYYSDELVNVFPRAK